MKVIVNKDKRSEVDRQYDDLFNKMVRDAGLNARQRIVCANYMRALFRKRMHEVEAVIEMGYLLALIESEHFGTDPRAAPQGSSAYRLARQSISMIPTTAAA